MRQPIYFLKSSILRKVSKEKQKEKEVLLKIYTCLWRSEPFILAENSREI